MILLLIPVAGLLLGLGLWAAFRGMGALNVLGVEGSGPMRRDRAYRDRPRPTSIREWFLQIRPGCLVAVIVAAGVWVLGWLIVLIIGLSYLS